MGHEVGDALKHAPGFQDKGGKSDSRQVCAFAHLGNDPHEDVLGAVVQDLGVLAIDRNGGRIRHGLVFLLRPDVRITRYWDERE